MRFGVGEQFVPRERRLDNPALADKMVHRSVSRFEVEGVLANNEVIEAYEHEDRVRYLLLGVIEGRPIHVVVAEDDIVDATVVVSVYEPDEEHGWDPQTGFGTRLEEHDDQ